MKPCTTLMFIRLERERIWWKINRSINQSIAFWGSNPWPCPNGLHSNPVNRCRWAWKGGCFWSYEIKIQTHFDSRWVSCYICFIVNCSIRWCGHYFENLLQELSWIKSVLESNLKNQAFCKDFLRAKRILFIGRTFDWWRAWLRVSAQNREA